MVSENNQLVKIYRLTAVRKKRRSVEPLGCEQISEAVKRILNQARKESQA